MSKATFAAGCFWGPEEAFRRVEGVTATCVGYTGGTVRSPSYADVCTGQTGHAEAVEVEYDPAIVPYEQLLETFWNNHNPTQVDRQGPDVGTQYRSAIFFHDAEQEAAAKASKERLEASLGPDKRIATEIAPAEPFYRAEEYHQQYMAKHGRGACASTVRA